MWRLRPSSNREQGGREDHYRMTGHQQPELHVPYSSMNFEREVYKSCGSDGSSCETN